ncbi:MAG: mechanosensitive ion channel domain-containing protein [Haloarculaceae archaeon]
MLLQGSVLYSALAEFVDGTVAAIPRVITGIVFLACAAVLVKVIMVVVRGFLARAFPHEEPLYRQFIATLVMVFLVFAVFLSFLSVVGLTAIAAALGTATGFLALGVSYALSGMIADAVAGVYLLRDPDFNPGDRVDVGGTVGTVKSIELRKTRLSVEDDTVVRANAEIEKKWTKLGDGSASE